MKHQHKYDAQGRQLCCTQEEKIYTKAGAKNLIDDGCCSSKNKKHDHAEHSDDDGHNHSHDADQSTFKMFLPSIISLVLLLAAIIFDNYLNPTWFSGRIRIAWYIVTYIPVGFPVIREAFESMRNQIGRAHV